MSRDSSAVKSQEDKQKSSAINPLQTQSSHKTSPDTENDPRQIICMALPTREGTPPDTAWDFSPISIGWLIPLVCGESHLWKIWPRKWHEVVTDHRSFPRSLDSLVWQRRFYDSVSTPHSELVGCSCSDRTGFHPIVELMVSVVQQGPWAYI